MHTTDPVAPSPRPAPLEPPIKLISPAITSAALQGGSARALGAPPSTAGWMGKTGKAKKGASFADIATKATKKPGGADATHAVQDHITLLAYHHCQAS